MAHLKVSVLGELEVSLDGVPVSAFESDKVRALLAYLVVEAGHASRRETLVGLLWPDSPEADARHSLSQALFNLRQALGDHSATPPYLLVTRDAIQFNRESDYALDLDQFNGFFEAWGKNQSGSTLLTQLEAMAALYRGEFLQQFYLGDSAEFEAWVIVQRESLHQRAMNALSTLANEYEQRGDYEAALRHGTRQLELDAWREEAHCQVMRLLALSGQRSAALAQYESCRKILEQELGVEPSAQTRALYEQIRAGTLKPRAEPAAPLPSAPLHNLPVPLTPFVGREQELSELAQMIADAQYRCISLVGPGGIGKTRLALQAAEQNVYGFAQGTAFVPLAPVGSVEAVIPAIANEISLAFYGPVDPRIQLLNTLRDKQMLLVVDNVEHLLAEDAQRGTIADLLIEILQAASQVRLLVTSREALNMQGEWIFEVQGLAFPKLEQTDGLDDYSLDEYSAVALFVQRARRARPGYELNAEDKMGVVRLCRLVEGMPLAIELAAAWMRVLSPMEIAKEIETSLDFLNAQVRDLPQRHRSMRAVFDHTWQMLSGEERQVLRRLSVFRGGFSRQAGEQVAGASLPVLSSLVIHSLLRRAANGRYDLHELIRQYAASRLAEDAQDLYMAQEKHSHYYLSLLEEKDVKLKSHDQKEAVAELTVEMDNIRAAWEWAVAQQRFIPLLRVSPTLWYLFEQLSWFKEAEMTFQKAAGALQACMQAGEPDPVHLAALKAMLAHRGFFLLRLGRGEDAYANLAPSAAFLRTSAYPLTATNSLLCLGIVCWGLGRYSEAEESLRESRQSAREHGERWYEAMAGEFLGRVAFERGAYPQAREYLSESLAILRQLGDPSMLAHSLSYLGRTSQVLGEFSEAEKLLREGLELAREINYRVAIGLTLDGLGRVAYAQGRHAEAEVYFSEGADLFREMGDAHRLARTLNHRGLNSLALKHAEDAEKSFQAALKIAYEGGWIPAALYALTGLAALDILQKNSLETIELAFYVLQHPASTQETKDLALRLCEELEVGLTQEEIEAARLRAGSKSLDEIVRRFLAGG